MGARWGWVHAWYIGVLTPPVLMALGSQTIVTTEVDLRSLTRFASSVTGVAPGSNVPLPSGIYRNAHDGPTLTESKFYKVMVVSNDRWEQAQNAYA